KAPLNPLSGSVLPSSLRLRPAQRSSDRIAPAGQFPSPRVRVHLRFEAAIAFPACLETFLARPNAGLPPREPGRSKGCGFKNYRPVDGGVEKVREPLHREVVRDHAAIYAQNTARITLPVSPHGIDKVARLVADRFQGCARQLVGAGISREAEEGAASI